MTQQNNGQLGDWAPQCAQAKPIEIATKVACLELFRQGNGYRKAAKMLGLKQYTVRDWLRRFKSVVVDKGRASPLRMRRGEGFGTIPP